MTPVYLPVGPKVCKAQLWLQENKIKHFPTLKVQGGHIFCFKNDVDAMAFKLTWS